MFFFKQNFQITLFFCLYKMVHENEQIVNK